LRALVGVCSTKIDLDGKRAGERKNCISLTRQLRCWLYNYNLDHHNDYSRNDDNNQVNEHENDYYHRGYPVPIVVLLGCRFKGK
jgi:hypothetical protein